MVVLIPGNSWRPGIMHSTGLHSVSFSWCIGISGCVCVCMWDCSKRNWNKKVETWNWKYFLTEHQSFGRSSDCFSSFAYFIFCSLSVLFTQEMLPDSFRFKLYVLRHYQLRYMHIYDFIEYSLFLRMFHQATNY